jgi:hypothetical protein
MEKANQWKHRSEGNIFNNTNTSMTICKNKYHRSYLHREVQEIFTLSLVCTLYTNKF